MGVGNKLELTHTNEFHPWLVYLSRQKIAANQNKKQNQRDVSHTTMSLLHTRTHRKTQHEILCIDLPLREGSPYIDYQSTVMPHAMSWHLCDARRGGGEKM